MQIIADLEGTTREPYGGCVGYFSFNGNLDNSLPSPRPSPIRWARENHPHGAAFPLIPHPACGHPLPLPQARDNVQAGGGWVNDSEPESEFQETVNKSKAMLKAVALAETFNR